MLQGPRRPSAGNARPPLDASYLLERHPVSNFTDITGLRFTRWTVVRQVASDADGNSQWECVCDCGATKVVLGRSLRRGKSKSCGCLQRSGVTHGHNCGGKPSLTYTSWIQMRQRCNNERNKDFPHWGGVGIKVCDRWQTFENFLEDMGQRPSREYSIDRWPNGAGDYEPGNARWATIRQQQNNQKSNRRFMFRGQSVTLSELVRLTGISRSVLKHRLIRHGWPIERAVATPVRQDWWKINHHLTPGRGSPTGPQSREEP